MRLPLMGMNHRQHQSPGSRLQEQKPLKTAVTPEPTQRGWQLPKPQPAGLGQAFLETPLVHERASYICCLEASRNSNYSLPVLADFPAA